MLTSDSQQELFETEVFRAICEAFLHTNVLTHRCLVGLSSLQGQDQYLSAHLCCTIDGEQFLVTHTIHLSTCPQNGV